MSRLSLRLGPDGIRLATGAHRAGLRGRGGRGLHRRVVHLLCRVELGAPALRLADEVGEDAVDGEGGRRVVRRQSLVVLQVVGLFRVGGWGCG